MMPRPLVSLAVLCCLLIAPVSVAEHPFTVQSVRVGIENTYKNGLWTPITLEWKSPIPVGKYQPFAIRCSDSDGTPITYYYDVHGEQTRNGTSVTLLAKLGRKDEPIQVSGLADVDFQTFSVPPPVNAERPIYLILGNDDIGLQGAIAELALREDRRPLLVKVNAFADLPDKWFGYEAVEMVVLTTTEPQLFEGPDGQALSSESPQIKALDDWLKLGGKMLLCAGKNAGQFLDNKDGFLHLFMPGKYDGMAELRNGTRLELFVNSKRQIFMNGTGDAPFMKMPRLTEPQGITTLNDGDLPLVLRCAHGLGTLIYFGGDLSEKPLKNWRDRTALVRNMMQWDRAHERGGIIPRSGAMLQLGYNDISGQIRSALDQFEGVRIVPFSIILIVLTAYWLVIGLFDWFLVHKVLKRPILTWVTFPLWIVLFSALTYVLAAPGRPVDKLVNMYGIHNLFTLWDVDSDAGISRESTWANIYSSTGTQHGKYPIRTDISMGEGGYNSWNGLPGSGLGGMAPKTVSPPVWQVGSEQTSYESIVNVPIQTRSTKSFFTRSYKPSGEAYIVAHLSDEEGIPVGTIESVFHKGFNPDYPFILTNCILVYGRWFLELGEIQSGQTIKLTKTTPRRELRDLLIPPKTRQDERLRGLATYNPQSTDLEYIVRVMSLHRALGGYESTGLHHAYMPSLDMSDLLTADRALLLGTMPTDFLKGKVLYGTIILRQSLPITLTERSPRLKIERNDTGPSELDEKIKPVFQEERR